MNLLLELEPRRGAFWSSVRATLRPVKIPDDRQLGLWRDVFVRQRTPWWRFLQSGILHAGAVALIWMITIAWMRQQSIVVRPAFDRSSVVTYSPEEYLAPLDTGSPAPAIMQKGDPEYSKQEIISVPREADNDRQTIVVPPDVRLSHDVAMPNIVAPGAPVPVVPLDATRSTMRMILPDTAVVAPAPELDAARSRTAQAAYNPEIIAPPPEITANRPRGIAGPEVAVVEPPPDLSNTSRSRVGPINIGPSEIIAPAPQLTLTEQHTFPARMKGGLPDGGMQPVAPPPSVGGVNGARPGGGLIALGIHPVAPSGPVVAPAGNRRGSFAATPQGKAGAAGTPDQAGTASPLAIGTGRAGSGNGGEGRGNNSLPSGLHVGSPGQNPIGSIASSGNAESRKYAEEIASAAPPRVSTNPKAAAPVSEDKVTSVDRQVFGAKRFYSMTLNMPNLNSSTGSWVIRFAELKANKQEGELLAPQAKEKSDPGYPLELIRANVHGTVTLYAVIHSDGTVGNIRVLNSPDERLDDYARDALGRWKFTPATKNGTPVALEAVVMIPFRVKRNF